MKYDTLSPAGQTRKADILGELQGAVRARRRRRRAIQTGAVALPLLAVIAGSYFMLRTPAPQAPGTPQLADQTAESPSEPVFQLRHIAFTETATPETQEDRSISDDELLSLLQAAGHDAGLVRRGEDVLLTGVSLQKAPPPADEPDAGA